MMKHSSSTSSSSSSIAEPVDVGVHRPWYRSGGMEVNSVGMGLNIALPLIFMARFLSKEDLNSFIILLGLSYAASVATGRRTVYCIVVVPTFVASLAMLVTLEDGQQYASVPFMILTLATTIVVAIAKVNICMSVCLHRYASHAAFKCGPLTQFGVIALGCLANQGGPIWWASQHRCHHKNCDVPKDPHSPIISGTEKAFGFFEFHQTVLEEYVPAHLDSVMMRVIDTWSFLVVALEMLLSYHFLGRTGLFVAYTSAWLCQTMTLWFNICNHPPPPQFVSVDGKPLTASPSSLSTTNNGSSKAAFHAQCNATDKHVVNPWNDPCLVGGGVYLPFVMLNALTPLFSTFVMESEHGQHHEHPQLAKRSPLDIAYWGFLYPLEQAGLVWNVVVPEATKKME
jgi:hypothetical protein